MEKGKKPKRGMQVSFGDDLGRRLGVNLEELDKFAGSIKESFKHAQEISDSLKDLAVFSQAQAAKVDLDDFKNRYQKWASEILANPNADGWARLCEILKDAKEDQRIKSSKGASAFVDLMLELAKDSFTASSAEEAFAPYVGIFQAQISSDIAKKHYVGSNKAKKWVVSEWEKNKSGHPSKADFARIYAKRVLNEFDEKVTDRTIREKWLKGK